LWVVQLAAIEATIEAHKEEIHKHDEVLAIARSRAWLQKAVNPRLGHSRVVAACALKNGFDISRRVFQNLRYETCGVWRRLAASRFPAPSWFGG